MKRRSLSQFLLLIGAIILLNYLVQYLYFRIDLTSEKRYSIAEATKKMLQNLDEEVVIKVYLEGEFPPGFKRLQRSVREVLEEFKRYSGNKVKFRFIDPLQTQKGVDQKKFLADLVKKGIPPTNIFATEGDKKVEKLIFPGAVIQYKNTETSVLLFRSLAQMSQGAPSPDQILNQSIENVEYNLAAAIRALTLREDKKRRIGFIQGHGEPLNEETEDLLRTLAQTYLVYKVNLPKEPVIEGLDAVVIIKPDSAFSETDKYKIDQYLMRGGKALFFVDAVGVYMDSVLRDKGSFTFPYNHNLGDLLFRYGVRLNPVLIRDLNSGFIPMVTGNMGDKPQVQPIPWHYYPILNKFGNHPITRNLGAVYTKFIGSIDTVKAEGIRKTPLLFTSTYTQVLSTPAFVTFNEARQQQDPKKYSQGALPVAFLLEGTFTSLFKNRILDNDPRAADFKAMSVPTQIIVCADGDMAVNDVDKKNQQILPLGYDKFSKVTFANKDFIINALDYLADDNGLIAARKKEIVLRPLDKIKLQDHRLFIQTFNMVLPLLMIVYFALQWHYFRLAQFAQAPQGSLGWMYAGLTNVLWFVMVYLVVAALASLGQWYPKFGTVVIHPLVWALFSTVLLQGGYWGYRRLFQPSPQG
ncbi:MAG TPA: gliding motility-associated ABC transporter substrate-binding protein GldG [Microscillaceae bacterium]|jgi:gliding-associated putative ABC transporter substrate-binding component GldG|nr:gliding motility-associated ABC transporter substrate-binding protein GldG [Microscillaceae bacterium]